MFDTLQEHLDHESGAAGDMQNAYALSQMEHRSGMAEVLALVAQGLHVVVFSGPAYCPRTDALLQTPSYSVASSHRERGEAELVAARAAQELYEDGCGETHVEVYPLPERPAVALVDDGSDDIPF